MPPRNASDVPQDVVRALSLGERESRDLVEAFTVDFAILLEAALPEIPQSAIRAMRDGASLAYTKRMRLAAELANQHLGDDSFDALCAHASDTARGWAAYIAGLGDRRLDARLEMIRPLADDHHFGVREWAWLGIRDAIASEPTEAVRLLEPWTDEPGGQLAQRRSEDPSRMGAFTLRPMVR